VKPAGLDPVPDRARGDACRHELGVLDDPVLPSREARDDLVDGNWDALSTYSGANPSRLAHAPDGADGTATELAPSVPMFA
jgi:hypothetical protein